MLLGPSQQVGDYSIADVFCDSVSSSRFYEHLIDCVSFNIHLSDSLEVKFDHPIICFILMPLP
jgi:hypothetical protein